KTLISNTSILQDLTVKNIEMDPSAISYLEKICAGLKSLDLNATNPNELETVFNTENIRGGYRLFQDLTKLLDSGALSRLKHLDLKIFERKLWHPMLEE
ncbi:hypothetical protein BGZ49_008241, partial [Haplosporangium sp. Z 27]